MSTNKERSSADSHTTEEHTASSVTDGTTSGQDITGTSSATAATTDEKVRSLVLSLYIFSNIFPGTGITMNWEPFKVWCWRSFSSVKQWRDLTATKQLPFCHNCCDDDVLFCKLSHVTRSRWDFYQLETETHYRLDMTEVFLEYISASFKQIMMLFKFGSLKMTTPSVILSIFHLITLNTKWEQDSVDYYK